MSLGYCMACDRLVAIRPVALKLGSRECEWRPWPHDARIHLKCGSYVDSITVANIRGDVVQHSCRKCGRVEEHELYGEACDGDKRDIR